MYQCPCGKAPPFATKPASFLHSTLYTLHSQTSGQAAVEFVVALVALLLIVSGGIFIFNLNTAQRDLTSKLRAEAGEAALGGMTSSSAQYIRDWDVGADGRAGTADDRALGGAASVFNHLASYGAKDDPADWGRLGDEISSAAPQREMPDLYRLRYNSMPMSSLRFVRRGETERVETDPVIRRLVLNRDDVRVSHEVYMPSSSGLY